MANRITNRQLTQQDIRMSNGLTSVFFETFCLVGASIADKKHEKDLLIWFGQRDYTIMGMGCEGFDIQEIAWEEAIFEQQKQFIIQIITGIKSKTNWHLLAYQPNEAYLLPVIDDFKEMIQDFKKEHIAKQNQVEIFDFDGNIKQYERCETHTVYMNFVGCIICNNQ